MFSPRPTRPSTRRCRVVCDATTSARISAWPNHSPVAIVSMRRSAPTVPHRQPPGELPGVAGDHGGDRFGRHAKQTVGIGDDAGAVIGVGRDRVAVEGDHGAPGEGGARTTHLGGQRAEPVENESRSQPRPNASARRCHVKRGRLKVQ
jgi:hypothetical protein